MDWHSFRRCIWTAVGLLILVGLAHPAHAQSASDDLDAVRVRLHHQSKIERAKLSVEDGPLAVHLPESGSPVMRLQAGETTTVGIRQTDVYLRRGARGLYATNLTVRPSGKDARWTLSFENYEDRTYTGGLHLAPAPDIESSMLMVNEVPIEDYVASVVAGEYGLGDTEGTKAMAVVARTYGLFASAKFGGAYDQADGTASQVYEGATAATEQSRQAARATKGEVLTYNGSLIQAVYFSSSGGHTANNEDVWKADEAIPYLRGRDDPYDASSPHHNWSATVDRSSLLQALTRTRGTLVDGFTIGERTPHGRVKTINVLQSSGPDHTMKANTFRLVVNRGVDGAPLKSTWFDARRQGSSYVFNGHGFGHGVGLSQYGAHEMAERGKDYREILRFYYTDVEIEAVDGVEFDPVTAPVAKEPSNANASGRRIGW
jgi:stage II sporulation protein D